MRWRRYTLCGLAVACLFGVLVGSFAEAQGRGDRVNGCLSAADRRHGVDNVVASRGVIYATTEDKNLYVSRNGGATWEVATRRAPGPVVAVLGDHPNTLVASGATGLFESDDEGRSWSAWFCASGFASFAATPDGATAFAAGRESIITGQGGGLYRTTDRGRTWTRYARLPGGNQNVNVVAIDPRGTNHVYVATETGGVLVSSDGGKDFQWRTIGQPSLGFSHGPQITAFAMSAHAPQTIWAGTRENGVYRGTHYGQQWRQNGLRRRYVDFLTLDPQRPEAIYAGEAGIVSLNRNNSKPHTFVSRDGAGWKAVQQLPAEWAFAADGTSGTIYAWHKDVIKGTTDHGKTWHLLATLP